MKRAQITVFFSLLLPLFLALLGACLESAYQQALRSQIQRGLMLCEYSFLSEYQKELWEQYGLFYIDTAYGGQEESQEKIQSRLLKYLNENLLYQEEEIRGAFTPFQTAVSEIATKNYSRATDDKGMGFYEQAVAYEQDLKGGSFLKKWTGLQEEAARLEAQEKWFINTRDQERENLDILRQRRKKKEEKETPNPTEAIWQEESSLLAMVIKDPENLSNRAVLLQDIPSNRTLLKGCGAAGRFPGNLGNDQWFHTYLLEKCSNAKDALLQKENGGKWLSYELEYILMGKDSDQENLKLVVHRLLLIRGGINYAYLLFDEQKKQEAYILAAVLVGVTLMPELIDAMQQMILLSWAYGESVLDVRGLLQGNEVAAVKTADSWKLPLSQLFTLRGHLEEYDDRTDAKGQSYEDYLRLLLTVRRREDKCLRGLDVVEGTIRTSENGKYLYMDQCIDGLSVQISFQASSLFKGLCTDSPIQGHGISAERRFAYDWQ